MGELKLDHCKKQQGASLVLNLVPKRYVTGAVALKITMTGRVSLWELYKTMPLERALYLPHVVLPNFLR
jgi:hypothetical protein